MPNVTKCVLASALFTLAAGSASAQLTITSVTRETRAHGWSDGPVPYDGGTLAENNAVVGSWISDLSSRCDFYNYARADQQSNVTTSSINAVGSVNLTLARPNSMTTVNYDTRSKFEVIFEVLSPTQVEFDVSTVNQLGGGDAQDFETRFERLAPDPALFARVFYYPYWSPTTASYHGVLSPGTYRMRTNALFIDNTAINTNFSNPATFAWSYNVSLVVIAPPLCGTSDFDGDGDSGTDADIEAFFACLGGSCCPTCFSGGSDFNGDGDSGTDADIESFFRVLGGGPC